MGATTSDWAEEALKEFVRQLYPVDPTAGIDDVPEMPADDSVTILNTELGNARRLANSIRGKAVHTEAWGWLLWNGKFWEIDHTGAIQREAVKMVDELYEQARQKAVEYAKAEFESRRDSKNERLAELAAKKKGEYEELFKWSQQSQTDQKLNSMVNRARYMLPAQVCEFDADPWLLNVQNGTIDLRTGELKQHDPADRITRIAGAAYDPLAACPTWIKSLQTWFSGDADLIEYMQKAIGYSLTGLTSEQCFWFLYGSGRNGKSVFTNVIAQVLRDYFRKAQAQTFMVRRNQGGASDGLAGLIGARFVSCSEMTREQRFDENLIKDLTGGGDPVTARHLYKSEFTFQPQLKIFMYGNSKPQITGTDLGIWRRVRLIPFTVTIPESDVDPNLTDKLVDELPGILAWAVRGCLKWQQEGLKMPAAVKDATEAYRAEEDVLAEFISENCVTGAKHEVGSTTLFNAWAKWGGDGSQKAFTARMKEQGYKVNRRSLGVYFQGIGLLADQ